MADSQMRPVETRMTGAAELDTQRMWVAPGFHDPLASAGLSSVSEVMENRDGHLLRSLPDRENWRLQFHDSHRPAYLKKHHTRTWRNWLRARFRMGPGATPGRVEADNVARLHRCGIDVMRLIAHGDRLHRDGLLESFVMTEELSGFTQLDHFLRERFQRHGQRPGRRRDPELLRLIHDVARVASKFHRLGFNHRDLYCCHFFIREMERGRFQVHLIDLQRVEQRRHFRRRWLVKDLAQLAYSAPTDRISCTQKMAFIKRYLGVRKLRPSHKRLIRQILGKQQLMERNLGAHP